MAQHHPSSAINKLCDLVQTVDHDTSFLTDTMEVIIIIIMRAVLIIKCVICQEFRIVSGRYLANTHFSSAY